MFPQLSLPTLVKLDKTMRAGLDKNVAAGIERLRGFQTAEGGFSYWAGSSAGADDWGSSYAGHFLLEAKKGGYFVPPEMLADWSGYQQRSAQSWVTGNKRTTLGQAYRLFTLALAGKPEMGAMNRLREQRNLDSVSARMLASAYQLSGLPDAARDLIGKQALQLSDYEVEGSTYGSRLRDSAIALDALTLVGDNTAARELADTIAEQLSSEQWHSTQSLAFSLMAMARFSGTDAQQPYGLSYRVGTAEGMKVENDSPYYRDTLQGIAPEGSELSLANDSQRVLYATIVSEGAAAAGEEQQSMHDLTLRVEYSDLAGNRLDITRLTQGSDLKVTLKVTNNSRRKLDNLALTHIVPAGWEIHNARLTGEGIPATEIDYQDIRDDRIYSYFSIKEGETKTFTTLMNAAYLGRFYQPSIGVEAMYDASRHARLKGQWVEVVK